ncbi:MAG TPA: hypothetical protein PKI77_14330, partial [Mycobacterium sp.]|nr:hypothetical protein [Mycobacterium sp.]
MKDGVNAPGLIAVGLGVVALVVSLFAFATSRAPIGASALIVALVLGGGGLAWLALEHRRVRHAEHHWHEQHPAAHEEPPT